MTMLMGTWRSLFVSNTVRQKSIPIQNPDDDGDYNGGFDNADNEVVLGNDGNAKKGFFYFDNTGIPQGATILEAYITVTSSANANDVTVNLTLVAADEDNPAVPNNAGDADGRPRTDIEVDWSNVEPWTANTEYQSPSLVPVIRELVERPGFAEDAVLIFAEDNGSTVNAHRKVKSYNGTPAQAAELYVRWTMAPGAFSFLLLETGDYLLLEN